MSGLWHVKTGLKGYGPDAWEDGYPTASDMTGVCHLLVSELDMAVQFAVDGKAAHIEAAKRFREEGNEAGQLGSLWSANEEDERAEELHTLKLNCEPERGKTAPLYEGQAEKWEADRRAFIEREFPGTMRDITDNTRLYVWLCDIDECDSCKEYREENED